MKNCRKSEASMFLLVMRAATLVTVLAFMFCGVRQVRAFDIITNGSFETGNFEGWGTKDMMSPFYPLGVRVAGDYSWSGLFECEPTDGVYAATHGFDGGGPDTIEIFQDINIPADHSAILTFDWRAGWDFTLGIEATVRTLDLVVEPYGGGDALSSTNILSADADVNMVLFDTGPKSALVDLTEFAGSSIRINFVSTIPEEFSGPAHLQIDNVALDVEPIKLSVIAALNIEEAIAEKYEMIEQINDVLEKERGAQAMLEELLLIEDSEGLDKGDIVTAKQKIHSGIQHQEQSIDALEQSIEKLKDSLRALGFDPELPVLNQPPDVNIVSPLDGDDFTRYEMITIEANASDIDGSVVKVEFFANGSKIGEDTDVADGWTIIWFDHLAGNYNLTAKATDDDEATTTSAVVGITVTPGGPPPL